MAGSSDSWDTGQREEDTYWDLDYVPDPDPATLMAQMALVAPGRRKLKTKAPDDEDSVLGKTAAENGGRNEALRKWGEVTVTDTHKKKKGHYQLKETSAKKKLFVKNIDFKVCGICIKT